MAFGIPFVLSFFSQNEGSLCLRGLMGTLHPLAEERLAQLCWNLQSPSPHMDPK